MNTSIKSPFHASKIVIALAAAALVFCSYAKAQVATPEQTYDGALAKGTPGLSKTTENEPNGYVERTWWDDGSGIKKLIEIRHYDKSKPPICIDHWITYTGKKGETIIDDYGWSKEGGQTAKREVIDGKGKTTYEWDPTPPSGHWKPTGFTPAPTPTPVPTATPTAASKPKE